MTSKIITIITVLGIFFFTHVPLYTDAVTSNYPNSLDSNEQAILHSFYDSLHQETDDSKLTKRMEDFIRTHPEIEAPYHLLLEHYLLTDQHANAFEFFLSIPEIPEHSYLKNGVLARLYWIHDDINEALVHFRRAISNRNISNYLIIDFTHFLHRTVEQDSWTQLLNSIKDPKNIRLAEALLFLLDDNYESANTCFKRLLASTPNHIIFLRYLGESYLRLSDPEKADSVWTISLRLAQQKNDRLEQTHSYINLSRAKRSKGQFEIAEVYCDSARVLAHYLRNRNLVSIIDKEKGNIEYMRGEYDSAMAYYESAQQLASKINNERSVLECKKIISQIKFENGDFAESFKIIEECENIVKIINSKFESVDIIQRKAFYYVFLNQDEYAKNLYTQAHQLAADNNFTDLENHTNVRIADLALKEYKFELARNAYLKYIRYLEKNGTRLQEAFWTGRVATSYYIEGMYKESKEYYHMALRKAKSAQSKPYIAWYRIRLADLNVIEGKLEEAIEQYKITQNFATKYNNVNMIWQIYMGLGKAYKKMNETESAKVFFLKAVRVIENSRKNLSVDDLKIGFFSLRNEVYHQLAQQYLAEYVENKEICKADSLLFFLSMTRGRTVQDQFFHKKHREDAEYQKVSDNLSRLQRQMRLLNQMDMPVSRFDSLQTEIELLRYSLISQRLKQINNLSDTYEKLNQSSYSILNVKQRLRDLKHTLLFYYIQKDTSFVVAIDSVRLDIIGLHINVPQLQSIIDSLMAPFHHVRYGLTDSAYFRADLAHSVYQTLFEPVKDSLRSLKNVIIIPDLSTTNLPFELLLTDMPGKNIYSPSDTPDYSTYFLVNQFNFIYSPTLPFIFNRNSSSKAKTGILVLANPFSRYHTKVPNNDQLRTTGDWNFSPLPYADYEAQQIRQTIRGSVIYNRENATKRVLREEAEHYNLIHIATHGFVDETFDAFSGLVLAPEKNSVDDGILMGYEVSDLRLNCDLITLSACETGKGKVLSGEGLLGLPWLFLNSGANTILMTLWKTDDKFASNLTPNFYNYLINQNYNKSSALSQAKRDIIGSTASSDQTIYYQHPFFWASFVSYGDPGMTVRTSNSIYWVGIPVVIVSVVCLIILIRFNAIRRKQ